MEIIQQDNVLHLPDRFLDDTPGREPDLPGRDYFVQIPDGKYVVEFIGAEGGYYRGVSSKVILWFSIADGDHKGKMLPAYCNVRSLHCRSGKRVRHPTFEVGLGCDLTMYLATLFPDRYSPSELPTEVPEADMMARGILIQVRKSKKTHKGQERPEAFHRSVVDAVLGWAE